jgi:hypothetical protein
MINYKQQITPQGIAQRRGLDVFITETIYSGEYINWGNALAYGSQLGSDIDAIVSGDSTEPIYDAVVGLPSLSINQWQRFHTLTGTQNFLVSAPTSGSGYFTFNATSSGAKLSYGGICQRLNLTTGDEYRIEVTNTIDTDTAILYVSTYFPRFNTNSGIVGYKINSTANTTYPVSNSSQCVLTSDFTAKSPNDVIVIYLTTTSASASVNITNISIKQKQDTLIPIYSEDIYGNSEKVLRRSARNQRFNT